MADLEGRLIIDWGPGLRTWIQYAERNDNVVLALLRSAHEDPPFPGFSSLMLQLSEVQTLPSSWAAILQNARGIYLLVCPLTKEQYVGSATGTQGFFGRWTDYAENGHGGNVALTERDPSNYTVSILEVVGDKVSDENIIALEQIWKLKLKSRDMGLNRN
jgi:hypothetical protein